jgi:hypothetical protein
MITTLQTRPERIYSAGLMNADSLDDLKRIVADEVERRALTWAKAGELSNGRMSGEALRLFCTGPSKITAKIRGGVAEAFGWGTDWPENPDARHSQDEAQVVTLIGRLAAEVAQLRAEVQQLRSERH